MQVTYPQIFSFSFNGKSFRKTKFSEDFCESFGNSYKKKKNKIKSTLNSNIEFQKNYFKNFAIRLEKTEFGYKYTSSKALEPYKGCKKENFGLSTEAGGYGGGWIKSNIHTPLSTKDVHTCALLNLVNENTGEHLLYHVFHGTEIESIKNFILKNFPRFSQVNLMPGDRMETNSTIKKIVMALEEINPKAPKNFYHISIDNPEVVAISGELKYIKNVNPDSMTFQQVTNQYNY